jgi:hypothetical protein
MATSEATISPRPMPAPSFEGVALAQLLVALEARFPGLMTEITQAQEEATTPTNVVPIRGARAPSREVSQASEMATEWLHRFEPYVIGHALKRRKVFAAQAETARKPKGKSSKKGGR